jgi:hypothetical protein
MEQYMERLVPVVKSANRDTLIERLVELGVKKLGPSLLEFKFVGKGGKVVRNRMAVGKDFVSCSRHVQDTTPIYSQELYGTFSDYITPDLLQFVNQQKVAA